MKTYTKTHRNKKAAETHLKKIKQRGGIAKTKPVKDGTQIEYYFPEKKSKGKNNAESYSDEAIAKYSGISVQEYKKLHPGTKRELINNMKRKKG